MSYNWVLSVEKVYTGPVCQCFSLQRGVDGAACHLIVTYIRPSPRISCLGDGVGGSGWQERRDKSPTCSSGRLPVAFLDA